jgi:putative hydrolase
MLKIDLHVHSLHSGHAYGSLYDILNYAADNSMEMIAVTDHGPAFPGGSGAVHFRMGRRSPGVYRGVRLLWGCEANILDSRGTLDLEPAIQEELELLLCNFHRRCGYEDSGVSGNTKTMLRVLKNPNVKILTHPLHPQYPYDFEEVFRAAFAEGVLLELNMAYLGIYGKKRLDEYRWMIDLIKKAGQKIIVNSDSHFLHEIGDDSAMQKKYKDIGLNEEIIINNNPQKLIDRLGLAEGRE